MTIGSLLGTAPALFVTAPAPNGSCARSARTASGWVPRAGSDLSRPDDGPNTTSERESSEPPRDHGDVGSDTTPKRTASPRVPIATNRSIRTWLLAEFAGTEEGRSSGLRCRLAIHLNGTM